MKKTFKGLIKYESKLLKTLGGSRGIYLRGLKGTLFKDLKRIYHNQRPTRLKYMCVSPHHCYKMWEGKK